MIENNDCCCCDIRSAGCLHAMVNRMTEGPLLPTTLFADSMLSSGACGFHNASRASLFIVRQRFCHVCRHPRQNSSLYAACSVQKSLTGEVTLCNTLDCKVTGHFTAQALPNSGANASRGGCLCTMQELVTGRNKDGYTFEHVVLHAKCALRTILLVGLHFRAVLSMHLIPLLVACWYSRPCKPDVCAYERRKHES